MNAIAKALAAIGMHTSDMERTDFYRASGRRAAAVLRSMGYRRERFPTYAGNAVTRWAAPETNAPVFSDEVPAFNVLVAALASDKGGNR